MLVISGVPHENLELPKLDELATGARAANLQHTLYKGMILPLVALAGLSAMTYRSLHADKIEAAKQEWKLAREQMRAEEEKEDHHG